MGIRHGSGRAQEAGLFRSAAPGLSFTDFMQGVKIVNGCSGCAAMAARAASMRSQRRRKSLSKRGLRAFILMTEGAHRRGWTAPVHHRETMMAITPMRGWRGRKPSSQWSGPSSSHGGCNRFHDSRGHAVVMRNPRIAPPSGALIRRFATAKACGGLQPACVPVAALM